MRNIRSSANEPGDPRYPLVGRRPHTRRRPTSDRHHETGSGALIGTCPTGPRAASAPTNRRGSDMADLSRRQLFAGAAGVALTGSLAACGSSGSSSPSTSPTQAAGQPKRGGNFRLGVTGGGPKDIMDGQNIITKPDQARLVSAFETLLLFNENYQLTNDGLAESVTQDNPKQYTIKLRQGIEFQNGKTMTADDVIYSIQRIGTKGNGLTGFAATATMDVAGMKKLDKYTVRLPLKTPDSTVPQTLGSYTFTIVPTGYKAYPHPQIGTGAYKLKSFTPGQQSVHERNPNYWRSGEPYFDAVTVTDFSDSTAQVNGLLGGQIDAMTDLPASQVKVVQSRGMGVLGTRTSSWPSRSTSGAPAPTSTRCSRARCRTPRTTRRTGRRSRAPGPTSSRCTIRHWPKPTRPSASRSSTRCSSRSTTSAGTSSRASVASSMATRPRSRGSSRARAPSTWIASATATARSGSVSPARLASECGSREQVQAQGGVGVHPPAAAAGDRCADPGLHPGVPGHPGAAR